MTVVVGDAEELRACYVAALDAVEQASGRTVDALDEARQAREVARDLVLGGRRLVDLEHEMPLQPLRASVADALAALERARHDAQRLLFQLLHAEGMTLAEIGRSYGISRQLVSRLVNEPEPDRHPDRTA